MTVLYNNYSYAVTVIIDLYTSNWKVCVCHKCSGKRDESSLVEAWPASRIVA